MINLMAGIVAVVVAAMMLYALFWGAGILGDLLAEGIKAVGGFLPAMFLVGLPIVIGNSSGAEAALTVIKWEVGIIVAFWLLIFSVKAVRQRLGWKEPTAQHIAEVNERFERAYWKFLLILTGVMFAGLAVGYAFGLVHMK